VWCRTQQWNAALLNEQHDTQVGNDAASAQ
jgi:hypothetical protein